MSLPTLETRRIVENVETKVLVELHANIGGLAIDSGGCDAPAGEQTIRASLAANWLRMAELLTIVLVGVHDPPLMNQTPRRAHSDPTFVTKAEEPGKFFAFKGAIPPAQRVFEFIERIVRHGKNMTQAEIIDNI